MGEVEQPVEADLKSRKAESARAAELEKPVATSLARGGVGARAVNIRRLQTGLGNAAFARLMAARARFTRAREKSQRLRTVGLSYVPFGVRVTKSKRAIIEPRCPI